MAFKNGTFRQNELDMCLYITKNTMNMLCPTTHNLGPNQNLHCKPTGQQQCFSQSNLQFIYKKRKNKVQQVIHLYWYNKRSLFNICSKNVMQWNSTVFPIQELHSKHLKTLCDDAQRQILTSTTKGDGVSEWNQIFNLYYNYQN